MRHSPDQRKQGNAAPASMQQADFIAGLGKGLGVLQAFDVNRQRLNATQAAQRVGLTRAAARRYLLTLQALGYLDSDGTQFWLTAKVLQFSGNYLASAQLPRTAQPTLDALSMHTDGAFSVVVADGAEVVIVARGRDSLRATVAQLTPGGSSANNSVQERQAAIAHARSVMGMAQGLHLGARLPMHATSTGQVLMAHWPSAQLDAWLGQHALRALTPHTITTVTALKKRLQQIRKTGWCCASQEHELGVQGLAVPVYRGDGHVVGALNVVNSVALGESTPVSDQDAVARRWLPWLQEAAQQLRTLL